MLQNHKVLSTEYRYSKPDILNITILKKNVWPTFFYKSLHFDEKTFDIRPTRCIQS